MVSRLEISSSTYIKGSQELSVQSQSSCQRLEAEGTGLSCATGHVVDQATQRTSWAASVKPNQLWAGLLPSCCLSEASTRASKVIQGAGGHKLLVNWSTRATNPPAATPSVWSWSIGRKSSAVCSSPSAWASLQGWVGSSKAAQQGG
jgi:hypothetical protein